MAETTAAWPESATQRASEAAGWSVGEAAVVAPASWSGAAPTW
jgi:hypothetical protein